MKATTGYGVKSGGGWYGTGTVGSYTACNDGPYNAGPHVKITRTTDANNEKVWRVTLEFRENDVSAPPVGNIALGIEQALAMCGETLARLSPAKDKP